MKSIIGIWIVILLVIFNIGFLYSENILVSNSGIFGIDGLYIEDGLFNGKPRYVKDDCEIRYKGCRAKWVLLINRVMYYRNMTDTELCPLDEWRTACKAKIISDKLPDFNIKLTNLPN